MKSIIEVLDRDLDEFERLYLDEIPTEAELTYRRNVRRVIDNRPVELVPPRPGRKRKAPPGARKTDIERIKKKYRHIEDDIETKNINEHETHKFDQVLPLIMSHLSIKDLGRVAQVNKQAAITVRNDNYGWRDRLREKIASESFIPISKRYLVYRAMSEYRLARAWSQGPTKLRTIFKKPNGESGARLDIKQDPNGEVHFTAKDMIMKRSGNGKMETVTAFTKKSQSTISCFALSKGTTLVGSSNGKVFNLSTTTSITAVTKQEAPLASRFGVTDIGTAGGGLILVTTKAGVAKLGRVEALNHSLPYEADRCSLTRERFCLTGSECGVVIGDNENGSIIATMQNSQTSPCSLFSHLLAQPKKHAVRLYDSRDSWSVPCARFDCSAVSSHFTDLEISSSLSNDITCLEVDDVKLIVGKTNGDLHLLDRRRPDKGPVRTWSNVVGLDLTRKRSIVRNWPKLRVSAIASTATSILGISPIHAFEISLQ